MLKLVTFVSSLLMVAIALAGNAFSIAPTHVVVDITHPQTLVYLVKNTGDGPIHLRLGAEFLAMDSSAYKRGHSFLTPPQEAATSLVPYILISPRALSLLPSETREVRVSIRVTKPLAPGTYRAHFFANMLEVAEKSTSNSTVDGKQLGVSLNLLLKIATSIYGNIGHPNVTPTFSCETTKEGKLRLNATNHSPWDLSTTLTGVMENEKTPAFTVHNEIYRDSVTYIEPNWTPTSHGTLHITSQAEGEKDSVQATCQL